jgi:hypothetical protein
MTTSKFQPSIPAASMQAIANPGLAEVAKDVQTRLKRVVEGL